jgi:restriction endonuclease S subunit
LSDVAKSTKDIVKENDILISMSGTIGNSCKIPKGIEAIINQRILKITPKNYDFDVLPLLINSIIGQRQLERVGTGGVQTNLTGSDILNILIPILPQEIQTQISLQVQESFHLRAESERLLALAKEAVEVAIEQGETEAEKLFL